MSRDLFRNIEKLKKFRSTIYVSRLDRINKDPSLLREVLRISRIAGKRLYIFIFTREGPSQWAPSVRDTLSENIDVSVYLYEIQEIDALINILAELCSSTALLIFSSEDLMREVMSRNINCGEIVAL